MNVTGRASGTLCQIVIAGLCVVAVALAVGCTEKATKSGRSPATWLISLRESVKDADALVVVIRGGCDDLRSEPLTFRVSGEIGEQETDVNKIASILALATAALTDGFDENKPSVMRKLATLAEPEVTEFLRKVVDGQVGTEVDPARQWDEEPGIRTSAVIGLEMRKAPVTREEWNRWSMAFTRPSDAAAIEIAGCLLGTGTVIRPGHFRLKSYTLGEAGIEALSRTPGPESLGLLTTAIEHPWAYVADSAELAIEKMIGESWQRSNRRRKIDEWLATHPDSWIKPVDESTP